MNAPITIQHEGRDIPLSRPAIVLWSLAFVDGRHAEPSSMQYQGWAKTVYDDGYKAGAAYDDVLRACQITV
jgi:hypothetical protein